MNNCSKTFVYLIIAALVMASIYAIVGYLNPKQDEVSLTALSDQVKNKEVKKIVISGNKLEIELNNGKKEISAKEDSVSLNEYGIKPSDVEMSVKNGESATLWVGLISGILPIILIAGFNMITAGGDSQKFQRAQQIITTAVIGFIIILSAFLVVRVLEAVFKINVLG